MTTASVTDTVVGAMIGFAPSPVRFVKCTHIVPWNGSLHMRVVDLR